MKNELTIKIDEILVSSFFEPIDEVLKYNLSREEYNNTISLLRSELSRYLLKEEVKNTTGKNIRTDSIEKSYKTIINNFKELLIENRNFNYSEFPTSEIQKLESNAMDFCNILLKEIEDEKYVYLDKLYQLKKTYKKETINDFFKKLKEKVPQIKSNDIKEFITNINY